MQVPIIGTAAANAKVMSEVALQELQRLLGLGLGLGLGSFELIASTTSDASISCC